MKFLKVTGYQGEVVHINADKIVRIITVDDTIRKSNDEPDSEKANALIEYGVMATKHIGVIETVDEILAQL